MSAAMESSLSDLPKLYEAVSKSIVRVERTGTIDRTTIKTGVIVSTQGHIVVGNGFHLVNGIEPEDVKVHLSDGRTRRGDSRWLVMRMETRRSEDQGRGPVARDRTGNNRGFESRRTLFGDRPFSALRSLILTSHFTNNKWAVP